MALFRSPSDRKQIGIIAERMFDKNCQRFMAAYYRETEKPYGYIFVDNRPNTPGNVQVLTEAFAFCRVYPTINKSLKPEEKVEANPPKDLEITASCATQFSRRTHKYFDLVWSAASWPAVQNYMQQAPHCKTIPERFGLAEMYTSTRNPFNPRLPTVLYAGERYWPVKMRHFSNGTTKWIYIHEDEPSMKSFIEETIATERMLLKAGTENRERGTGNGGLGTSGQRYSP